VTSVEGAPRQVRHELTTQNIAAVEAIVMQTRRVTLNDISTAVIHINRLKRAHIQNTGKASTVKKDGTRTGRRGQPGKLSLLYYVVRNISQPISQLPKIFRVGDCL
jgi:hypothetical protein